MCDEKFLSHPINGHPQITYAGRATGGGEGFKPGGYVRISTVYLPFLKIFLIKKKNEHD